MQFVITEGLLDELQRQVSNIQFGIDELKEGYESGRDDLINAIIKVLELLSSEDEVLGVRRMI